jgi:predicted neutral ceramidase superfamily lipid hydrolase
MADLTDLYSLNQVNSDLRNRVVQAVQIVATEIVLKTTDLPTDHAARKSWAVAVIGNHEHWGAIMTRFLVAQYHASDIAVITGATKETLLDVIRSVVSVFAAEHAGG